MSTENMRKLIMLAESLNEDDRQDAMDRFPDDYAGDMEDLATRSEDEYCPTCDGWGEILPPDVEQDMDNIVPCPDCGPGDEYKPRLKSQVIKDLAHEMDMDWTDLGLSDVEPEDLKGFPKVNESFTRKHFQMVADTLQKIEDPEVRRAQAEEYAEQFAAANPRFRRDLFMKAAGVEELDEVQTLPREIKDRDPIKPDLSDIEYETCPECGVEGGHENGCAVLGALYNEDLNEEQSEFRLKDIVGSDCLDALLSDLNTGGIDYTACYFEPLYFHFLDEYPDEIPVGARTGRPDDPEDYVLDNLERYHSEEIKQYMNVPDMDESLSEDEDDGDVPSRKVSDEELLAKIKSKLDDAIKYIALGMKEESGNGDAKQKAIQVRRLLKDIKAAIESGEKDALGLRPYITIAFKNADELADLSYYFDDVLIELQDIDNLLYLHLSGRPVAIDESEDKGKPYICVHAKKGKHECYADTSYAAAKKAAEHWGLKSTAGIDAHLAIDEAGTDGKRIDYPVGSESWEEKFRELANSLDIGNKERELYNKCADDEMNALLQGELEEASCPCGKEGCECGPDCDCEPVEEGFSLDSIVESLLDERGQPKDYEMSDEELAAEIEDETSEFERDHIDKEIEDEELGLRFD